MQHKTNKDHTIAKSAAKRKKQMKYDKYIKELRERPAQTWSARMPAYAYTILSPDPRYRPKQQDGGEWHE